MRFRSENLTKPLNLPVEDFAEDISARKLFSMRVPLPLLKKWKKGILKIHFFTSDDSSTRIYWKRRGLQDPLDEQQKNAVPNILHKYQNRLLFMAKEAVQSIVVIASVIFLMIKTQAIKRVGNKQ